MPNLDELFDPNVNRRMHPRLGEMEALIADAETAQCKIERRREGFIFRPALIYLYTKSTGGSTQVDSFDWDETLNSVLIERGVQAVSQDNEGLRFSIMLRSDLQRVEVRYGEGYFNAIVLEFVQQTFGALPEIAAIIQKVGPGRPYHGKAYRNAADLVEDTFTKAARTLAKQLKYDPTSGKRILLQAIKLYLDERFSVSPGELLNIGGSTIESRNGPTQQDIKKVVIFDTNAYRSLTFGLSLEESRAKAISLRANEKHVGCSVLAHPIVIWELLSHLVDSADPGYPHCMHALVALGEHASSRNRQDGGIDIIADALSTVCRELFGRLPPGYEQGLQNLGSLVTYITKNAPNISDAIARQNIQKLGLGMEAKEKEWVNGMQSILSHFSPEVIKQVLELGSATDSDALQKVRTYFASEDFFKSWSAYVVISNALDVGIANLTPAEIDAKANIVRQLFPVPFKLMSTVLQKLAQPSPANVASGRAKRWNFVWDSMISFSIGPGTINDSPVYFITGDREIIHAAQAAGHAERVLTLDDYLKSIGMT
jgi:hypothetical protein